MSCFTSEQLSKISNLVREIEKLSDIEKLLLYLQLPCGRADSSTEGKHKVNGKANPELFTKKPDQETTQTYTWILSHLEEDSSVSLPKQEVYDEYKAFCQINRFEPLCVADFGKAMKHAFPCIKPRRLGQRGNSKYCYSGLRKKYRLQAPSLLDLSLDAAPGQAPCSADSIGHHQPMNQQHHCQQDAGVPMDQHHHHHHHHQQQQQQQPQQQQHDQVANPFPCCEAINLKIEPGIVADEHNHHNLHHQQSHSHGLYAGHHHAEPKLHLRDNGESNMTQSQADGSAVGTSVNQPAAAVISNQSQPIALATCEHPTMHSLADYHAPGNEVQPATLNHLARTDSYAYTGVVQRFGTPDDDDYNHNYQDLNRPIVSELNPFSDQCFAYGQHTATPSTSSTPQHHHHHQHQTSDHQAQGDTMHASGHNMQPNLCVNDNGKSLHQSSLPHSLQANLGNRQQQQQHQQQQATTNGHTMTSTTITDSPNNRPRQHGQHHHHSHSHHHNHHLHHHQQQQQQQAPDSLKPAEDSTAATGPNSNIHDHLDHEPNRYQPTAAPNKDPPHLHLSINNTGNGSSDQFPVYSRLNHSSVDCCASPFQSPASTPYPMMGNNFGLSNEIHDYYPSDCIRYAEQ